MTNRHRSVHPSICPMRMFTVPVLAAVLMGVGAGVAWGDPGMRISEPQPPPAIVSPDVIDGSRPSVSGDGRWVVHQGLDGDRSTVFRVDRDTGESIELTPVPHGVRSGHTLNPIVSADGCVVVVQTELQLDPFRDDDRSDRWDVYRLVTPECGGAFGQWELVSAGSDGSARDDVVTTSSPAMTASGGLVAFTHPLADRSDGITTITLVDLTVPPGDPARTTPMIGVPAEPPTSVYRHRGAGSPSLSADGRYLAFVSDTSAAEPLPDWGEGDQPGGWVVPQAFVWDRRDDDPFTRVQMISSVDGAPAPGGASTPILSGDGRVVAFTSSDRGLVPDVSVDCESVCPTQVLRVDQSLEAGDPGYRTLVSGVPVPDGSGSEVIAGNRSSWLGDVNRDGSRIVFVTRATNLVSSEVVSGGDETDGDVLVADVSLGRLSRLSDTASSGSSGSSGAPGAHANPSISDSGRVIVLDTLVADLLGGPTVDLVDLAALDPDGATTARRHVVAFAAVPTLSLAALDFGTVLVGWPSDELYVSLLNEGPGLFEPATVTSSDAAFAVTDTGTCSQGVALPAGASCTVTVVFTPTDALAHQGILTVAEVGPGALSVSAAMAGAGGEPTLQATPAGIDLGGTVIGGPAAKGVFSVENVGFFPALIAEVAISGANAGDFMVLADGCRGATLEAGTTCQVEIGFTPTAANRRTASIAVTTATGEYTAVVVAGMARYETQLVTATPAIDPGGTLGLGLAGFPADKEVVIGFGDSTKPLGTVRTGNDGRALVTVDVSRRERPGTRTLVASGPDGAIAQTQIEVRRRFVQSPGTPGFGLG